MFEEQEQEQEQELTYKEIKEIIKKDKAKIPYFINIKMFLSMKPTEKELENMNKSSMAFSYLELSVSSMSNFLRRFSKTGFSIKRFRPTLLHIVHVDKDEVQEYRNILSNYRYSKTFYYIIQWILDNKYKSTEYIRVKM